MGLSMEDVDVTSLPFECDVEDLCIIHYVPLRDNDVRFDDRDANNNMPADSKESLEDYSDSSSDADGCFGDEDSSDSINDQVAPAAGEEDTREGTFGIETSLVAVPRLPDASFSKDMYIPLPLVRLDRWRTLQPRGVSHMCLLSILCLSLHPSHCLLTMVRPLLPVVSFNVLFSYYMHASTFSFLFW